LHATELPEFDMVIGGIPCPCHSNMGRAKKTLAGKPELDDTGDLCCRSARWSAKTVPVGVVFENVPAFGTSLAGELLVSHLCRIGYHVTVEILRPNEDWAEFEDRQRWLLVGALDKSFRLQVPHEHCGTPVSAFLESPDPAQDRADAERIARIVEGLRVHNARLRAAGHGFGFTEISGSEFRLATVAKSYYKINLGIADASLQAGGGSGNFSKHGRNSLVRGDLFLDTVVNITTFARVS
jgi:site-specific DNA-cytosine methylase